MFSNKLGGGFRSEQSSSHLAAAGAGDEPGQPDELPPGEPEEAPPMDPRSPDEMPMPNPPDELPEPSPGEISPGTPTELPQPGDQL